MNLSEKYEKNTKYQRRHKDSHKSDFGRVLIVGGSLGMSGAVSLSGMAALQTGAGLVTLAVPQGILPIVASFAPEYMTIPLPEDRRGRVRMNAFSNILSFMANSDALAIGPGLGLSLEVTALVFKINQWVTKPIVFDADALNAFASRGPGGVLTAMLEASGPRILTPHPGEFARLTGVSPSADTEERKKCAKNFAKQTGVVLVLKGRNTIITDGNEVHVNQTGNPAMATGGSGDILTGMIVSLIGQKFTPLNAAIFAVHLHGLAGDIAVGSDEIYTSVLPTELLRNLKQAIQQHQKSEYMFKKQE